MPSSRRKIFRDRRSTRQFLVYKTETKRKEKAIGPIPSVEWDRVKKEFPNLISGESFFDQAPAFIQASRKFGALMIRIDYFKEKSPTRDPEGHVRVWINVAKAIGEICKKQNGIWGPIRGDLFGIVLPGKDDSFCRGAAKDIQNRLSSLQSETISIGISTYPTLNYTKSQILENAGKALDHAAFFNGNSMVSFDAVSLNISGDERYQKGDIQGAIKEFKTGLMLDPSNVNLHNSLGVCYGVLGSFDQALNAFDTALWLDPNEIMAIYNTGLVHLLMAHRETALDFFLQANQGPEEIFEVLFQIGRIYLDTGKPEVGKKFIEKAAKLNPDSGSVFRLLGECYVTIEKIEKAAAAYEKAVKKNPSDAASLSALGHLFDIRGENLEIATALCEQSVKISPKNGLFRHRLGERYLKQNRFEEALEQFQKAITLGHDSIKFIEEINKHHLSKASSLNQ